MLNKMLVNDVTYITTDVAHLNDNGGSNDYDYDYHLMITSSLKTGTVMTIVMTMMMTMMIPLTFAFN